MGKLKALSRVPLTLAFGLALTPVVFGAGPWIESRLFPVSRNTSIANVENSRIGTSFFVNFRKLRQCEFLGLVWYEGPVRLVVDFAPDAEDAPKSRPVGDQYAGPWLVQGLHALGGSRAFAYHRCHPLWVTITTFYEG
ncbi:hypothetical protein OO012_15505 [Rhodobacteraceae bacterium KMM 6894]|nr:hypothetical protein [Rhodobacteraceae bacterium KMM 6894]